MQKLSDRITICGSGHWSVRGVLDTPYWNWFLEIEGLDISDDQMRLHIIEKGRGQQFLQRIRAYLPEDAEDRIVPPIHVPGDSASFQIRLAETADPVAVEKVLRQYFPRLMALADNPLLPL